MFKTRLIYYPNAPFKREIQLKGADEQPVDLSGCSIRMQIRERKHSPDILLELSTTNNLIIIKDAINGVFEINLPINLIAKSGVFDVEVSFPDGTIISEVLEGKFTYKWTATR
jgi:hypothetical protein